MIQKVLKVILNLHDGDGAGAAQSSTGGENDGGTNSTSTDVRSDVRARGEKLGISDDLMQDFQAAVDSKKSNSKTETNTESKQTEQNDKTGAFDELVKGEYKTEYQQRMQEAFKDRFEKSNKQIAELQSNALLDNKIISFIANKYQIDPTDKNALLSAVEADNDLFINRALEDGVTAEEARANFVNKQKSDADKTELEQLRSEKAARELDARLRGLAVQTQQIHPEFDLEKEFENPDFRTAFELVAQQNEAKNKRTGQNGEIYDLTKAYEMAHWDTLRKDAINRAGSAALSAAAQNIAANGARPLENVAAKGNAKPAAKSVAEMSDEEFNSLYDDVLSGKARIPR